MNGVEIGITNHAAVRWPLLIMWFILSLQMNGKGKKKEKERKVTGLHLTGEKGYQSGCFCWPPVGFPTRWNVTVENERFTFFFYAFTCSSGSSKSTSKQFDKKWYLPNFHFCFAARGYIWTEYRAFASSTCISKVAKVFGNERTMWVSIHYILINWSFLLGWMLFLWNGSSVYFSLGMGCVSAIKICGRRKMKLLFFFYCYSKVLVEGMPNFSLNKKVADWRM